MLLGSDGTLITVFPHEAEPQKLRGDIDNYVKTIMDGLNGKAGTTTNKSPILWLRRGRDEQKVLRL
jgi:Holliday junction resolvase RusA-like endonuclease